MSIIISIKNFLILIIQLIKTYINYIAFYFLLNSNIIMYLIYWLITTIILLYLTLIENFLENNKYIMKSIVKLSYNIFNNLIFWKYLYLIYIFVLF